MVNSERLKTVNLYEKRDPIRNLWRNVLIVGIEDLIKKYHVDEIIVAVESENYERSRRKGKRNIRNTITYL